MPVLLGSVVGAESGMTRNQRIKELRDRIAAVRAAIAEAVTSGVSSATIASAGNSQSYTRLSLSDLRAELRDLQRELAAVIQRGPIRRTCPDFRL